MPRPRDERRDQAKKLWLDSGKQMLLKDIADQLNTTDSTIRKWKSQDKWEGDATASKPKKKTTKPKKSSTPKKANNSATSKSKGGAPKGNKNALGNKGGAAPRGNQNAVRHGFFSKVFPDDDEIFELLEEIEQKGPEDIIWDQIMIQYTAILRSQKIMYTRNGNDHLGMLKKESPGMFGDTHEWEVVYAHERQATFLNAQSRAMGELRSLIKQFVSMADEADERRLKLEAMNLNITKLRAELSGEDEYEDDGFLAALDGKTKEVWIDEVSTREDADK